MGRPAVFVFFVLTLGLAGCSGSGMLDRQEPLHVAVPVRSALPIAMPGHLRNRHIPYEAVSLIITHEVRSRQYYENHMNGRPHYGGGSGGVLIGFGYNLGSVTEATFRRDWGGHLPKDDLDRLTIVVGLAAGTSQADRDRIKGLVAALEDINVPWDAAMAVFEEVMVPDYVRRVRRVVPNTDRLHPRSLGALVALAYNRGEGGFVRDGGRFTEMRAITRHMETGNFAAIPDEFRAMKRLWTHRPQIQRRRDLEADLFESGVEAQACTKISLGARSAHVPQACRAS